EIPYTPLTLLGHGQKGVVEKVRHAHSSAIYARKTYRLSPRSARQRALDRAAYVREIEITRRLQKHRHIVRVVASYSTSDTLAVILEPAADGGDLKTYLARYAAGDVETRRDMQRTLYHAYGCLASGLAFMHSQRIRHRDVKPENILVHGTEVLFADFGISRDYSGKADSWTDGRADAFTAKYCAPEVQDQGVRSSRSDVWALGCVFLLLYSAVWESDVI
ncbi:kinase-like protein, partial [Lentithecium fluviatile CBS 122367]